MENENATVETSEEVKPVQAPAEPEKKYTDKDVDTIINKKFAKWKEEQDAKESEAKKLSKMNADEKAAHEKKQLEERIQQLEEEKTLTELTGTTRAMLAEADIVATDDLLKVLVSKDAEETKTAVESFKTLFQAHVDAAVNDRLKSTTPKTGVKANSLTKQDIFAVKDRVERQRLIAENPELFKK